MIELLIALALGMGGFALVWSWLNGLLLEKFMDAMRRDWRALEQRVWDLEHAPSQHDALELRIDGVTEEWKKECARLDRERLELDMDLDGFKTAIVTKAEALGAQTNCLQAEGVKLAVRVEQLESRSQQWADFCAAFGKAWHAQPSKN